MLKVYTGPVLIAKEFLNFDLGITNDQVLPHSGLWFKFSERGVSLYNSVFEMGERRWRVPIEIDETIFEARGIRIATLYNRELRMKDLLEELSKNRVELVLGYIKTNGYNPYILMASGWGCSQTIGIPTLIVNFTGDTVGYSLFSKMNGFSDGVQMLFERYSLMNLSLKSSNIQNERAKRNKGIEDD